MEASAGNGPSLGGGGTYSSIPTLRNREGDSSQPSFRSRTNSFDASTESTPNGSTKLDEKDRILAGTPFQKLRTLLIRSWQLALTLPPLQKFRSLIIRSWQGTLRGLHHLRPVLAALSSKMPPVYHRGWQGAMMSWQRVRPTLASWVSHKDALLAQVVGGVLLLTIFLMVFSQRRSGTEGKDTLSHVLTSAPCQSDGEKQRPFIYVYDFGGRYTDEVRRSTPAWFSEVYDAEQHYLQYVMGSSTIRTWEPEKALLFYVPFYAAYFLACQFKDWENNMKEAVMRTSEAWESILNQVRQEYPFFNRTNGADHFSVLSMDFGRCQSLPYVEPRVYGDMFFLLMNGDKMLRSTHAHSKRNMQVLSYNYGAHTSSEIPDIPCYRSDMDIVMPPTLEETSKNPMPLTSPFAHERTLSVVFRFRVDHHHKQPVLHSNHHIRRELYQLYSRKGLGGWEFGVKEPEKVMREDLARSAFCVCPPGHSQWSSRLTKAILAGCIPVTFFKDHDNPWQDEIDYSSFSVNVDPDALDTLFDRLEGILNNKRKLQAMQRNLEKVQRFFVWNETCPMGIQAHASRLLWCKAKRLDQSYIGHARREAQLILQTINTKESKARKRLQ